MRRPRLGPPEPRAFREFVEALLDFSDDPGPANLERYLAASRAIDDSRPAERDHTAGRVEIAEVLAPDQAA